MRALLTSIIVSLSLPAIAAETPPQCLPELPASAVKVMPGTGWTVFMDRPFYLSGARMSAGPPETLTVLRGEDVGKNAVSYGYDASGPGPGLWLDCLYGEGGEIVISRGITGKYRECLITRRKRERGEQARVEVSCK